MATKAKPIGVAGTKPGFLKSSAEIAMETIQRDTAAERAQAEAEKDAMKQAYSTENAETVLVTRVALEGMAARAGLSVTWRRGEPYFSEAISISELSPREREVEKRCRQLEAENTRLRDQLKSAVRRDDVFKDEVKRQADEDRRVKELREKAARTAAEQEAVADILAKGATPADVKALEDLLGKTGVELRDTVVRPPSRQQQGVSFRGASLDDGSKPLSFSPPTGQALREVAERLGKSAAKAQDDAIRDLLLNGNTDILVGKQMNVEVRTDPLTGDKVVGWKSFVGAK